MNNIELLDSIEKSYSRYLETTFYFKDPVLRESFRTALSSGTLSKGPYLESTPIFKTGQTPSVLFKKLLGREVDKGLLNALHGERYLYAHQEKAIQQSYSDNNILVATGTGSGKTEAFLYPIILSLYKEFLNGTLSAGVRALILYPMNALANDQRDRLGEICKKLSNSGSDFNFTFGQYIGSTPEDEKDNKYRQASRIIEERRSGELVLRSEMRSTPPNILLTNYSMLEFLLLRPDDSPLFDNGNAKDWKFIVLDEAHQYRGSKGAEMSLLIRRLKHRILEGGCTQKFHCIATSATLLGKEDDKKAVAKFASDLFGEDFSKDNIILEKTKQIKESGKVRLSSEDYTKLVDKKKLVEVANKVGIEYEESENYHTIVGKILLSDSRAVDLRELLKKNAIPVIKVAENIFPEEHNESLRLKYLSILVELLTSSSSGSDSAPLIALRYHFFLRTLEGVFLTYQPTKKVSLIKESKNKNSSEFEVALCRECGQHYLVGRISQGKLVESIRNLNHPDFDIEYFKPIDELESEDQLDNKNTFILCTVCAAISKSKLNCGHSKSIRVLREEKPSDEDRKDQMKRCSTCGYHAAGNDPVREIIYGHDGPNSVIATALYKKTGNGSKKILAFTDNRQEAAFFAWYLQKSYEDIKTRNLLYEIVEKLSTSTNEGLSLNELVYEYREKLISSNLIPSTAGSIESYRIAWSKIYNELLTDEKRISLEGTGLVKWKLKYPEWIEIPAVLKESPLSLDEKDARNLLFILLDTLRGVKAVEIITDEHSSINWGDIGVQGYQFKVRLGKVGLEKRKKQKSIQSWEGKQTRRFKYLSKLLQRKNLDPDLVEQKTIDILTSVWQDLRKSERKAENESERLLLTIDNDAKRLNPLWYRLELIDKNDHLYQCDTCGRLQAYSVLNVCSNYHCNGNLEVKKRVELSPNHYRSLYEEKLPAKLMRVEEHTAQLNNEIARTFQNEFKNGKINVLSCSTTFELGVDLGDLDNIFLRNVPPESFNYAQRVGRSGRRMGKPGIAITYCRRRPHDLYHFNNPERMISGIIKPPVISIKNDKIAIRHLAATALSLYFKQYNFKFKNVGSLLNDFKEPYCVKTFREFLLKNQTTLENALKRILPEELISSLGVNNGEWIGLLTDENSTFQHAEDDIISDYNNLQKLKLEWSQIEDYKNAGWAKYRLKTILNEPSLTFLSRKTIIPKYGFPVDVVELDTHRISNKESSSVSLQRDLSLAIAEFAPGSEVVANKKLWKSYGLKKVAEREWGRGLYAYCKSHNNFINIKDEQKNELLEEKRCCEKMIIKKYIDPEFGFMTKMGPPRNPERQVKRLIMSRPFFADFVDRNKNKTKLGFVDIWKVVPGRLINLCEGFRGRGFYICEKCGAGFKEFTPNHKDAFDKECFGKTGQYSLAHEIETDVLKLQFYEVSDYMISDPISFAYSLGFSLLEGAAEVLEIPSTDLNITISQTESSLIPPIILYDNVPGGAGLVARLEEEEIFISSIKAALERVSGNCGCGQDTSCYGCLRSYRNQYIHERLNRGPVLSYLNEIM